MTPSQSNNRVWFAALASPLGRLLLIQTNAGLSRIGFEDEPWDALLASEQQRFGSTPAESPDQLKRWKLELDEYFEGERRTFSQPLDLPGTNFRQHAQRELTSIRYGSTVSYGEFAKRIGHPGAARAVGTACATNPIPIALPCHRIVAANGGMGGYSGQLWRKTALLELEAANSRFGDERAPRQDQA